MSAETTNLGGKRMIDSLKDYLIGFKQGKASRQAEIIEMINERIKSGFTDEGDKWILRDLKQQILEEKKSETEKTNRRKTTYKRIRR